ncbi:MAG: substrate-binding domain-containing protein [Acidimicrobiales bacterium]
MQDVSGSVNVSGSSTVEPISTRVKELYNESVSGDVEITVTGPGTSAGFEDFCPGNTDINDASRAIKDTEAAECVDYVELKVAFDGIAVLVNPSDPLTCVSFADLYAIAGPESEDNTWEEAASLAAELGSTTADWPTGPVQVVAPGTESGTYGSFIEIALEGTAEERLDAGAFEAKTDENGDPVLIRSDYAGQPDDNVIIQGIEGTENSFGWVGFAFAEAAGDAVKILEVQDPDTGECVAPSLETIADGSYPLSRSLYIYVNTAKAKENPALVSYVDFYLGGAYPDAVENAFDEGVGYVALPDDLKAETDAAWAAAKG